MFATSRCLAVALVFVCAGSIQAAPIIYGDYAGTNFTYNAVTEQSSTDSSALYGAPSIAGDALAFNPTGFGISASGGGFRLMDGTLTSTIVASGANRIGKVVFTERGDYTLAGNGTANTNVSVSAALFVRVTKVDGVSISPITFSNSFTFTPVDGNQDGIYDLALDRGNVVVWSGSGEVDVTALLRLAGISSGFATQVDFSVDNQLQAWSETTTVAYIKKKEIDGFSVAAEVPEPATMLLLAMGSLALSRRRRK